MSAWAYGAVNGQVVCGRSAVNFLVVWVVKWVDSCYTGSTLDVDLTFTCNYALRKPLTVLVGGFFYALFGGHLKKFNIFCPCGNKCLTLYAILVLSTVTS